METKLFNEKLNSYAVWNGSAYNDIHVPGAYFYSLEKAANNGYFPIEQSDREKALEWFSELGMKKYSLLRENNIDLGTQFTEGFKSKIEEIWRKETQSIFRGISDKVLNCTKCRSKHFNLEACPTCGNTEYFYTPEQKQVDFEMLKSFINDEKEECSACSGSGYYCGRKCRACNGTGFEDNSEEQKENLQLFFELLTKSSSFAHKAHKELNKLK